MSVRSRKEIELHGKVLAFLKKNPLSTAEEIFKATGSGICGMRYVKPATYNGRRVYRLNHEKLRKDGLL